MELGDMATRQDARIHLEALEPRLLLSGNLCGEANADNDSNDLPGDYAGRGAVTASRIPGIATSGTDDGFSLLLSNWGQDAGAAGGDLNGDSRIDDSDLSLLLAGQIHGANAVAGQSAETPVDVPPPVDLNVTLIERTPRYDYDAEKNNPEPGDIVTFHGHIINWGDDTPVAEYHWQLDGQTVATGELTDLLPDEERIVEYQWTWQDGNHQVKLIVDPAKEIDEASEVNNEIEDRTNGVIVGFWVE